MKAMKGNLASCFGILGAFNDSSFCSNVNNEFVSVPVAAIATFDKKLSASLHSI